MRLRHFIFITVLIILLGLNLAGQGITKVVGEGPWQVVNITRQETNLEIIFLDHKITIASSLRQPEWQQKYQEVKNKLSVSWGALWEQTQAKIARLLAE